MDSATFKPEGVSENQKASVLSYIGDMTEELAQLAAQVECKDLSEALSGTAQRARALQD